MDGQKNNKCMFNGTIERICRMCLHIYLSLSCIYTIYTIKMLISVSITLYDNFGNQKHIYIQIDLFSSYNCTWSDKSYLTFYKNAHCINSNLLMFI